MSAQSKHFDAGVLAGRLEAARQFGAGNDLRVASLETELRGLLQESRVTIKGSALPPYNEMRNQIREISGEVCGTCFDIGMDLLLLQAHIKIYSIATKSQFPPEVLSNALNSLRPLIEQIRIRLAEINAPDEADRFLIRISKALDKTDLLFSSSSGLIADSEVLVARIRSYLETLSAASAEKVFQLKPSIYGVGVDLEALFKRIRRFGKP